MDANESCSVLRVRIRLISIARFDSKGLYIGMTCGWLISSYAKLRCHVGKRSKLRCGRERGRKREKEQGASIGSVSRCLSRRKVYETRNNDKSPRYTATFETNSLRIDKQEIERDMNNGLCAIRLRAFCPLIEE